MPTLKRKNTEEEQPRKKESWASTPSSSVVYIRPTLASIITAQGDDAQERDTRHEPSDDVGCTTITTTTTTTTAPVTIAKKTEVEKKAEVVSEGRAQHPEVRPRPNHKPQKVKSNVRYQTHWKVSGWPYFDIQRLYFLEMFTFFSDNIVLSSFPTFRSGAFARNFPMETGSLMRNLLLT